MASSESSITTLLRPRFVSVAVIAAATAALIGYGLWRDSRRRTEQEEAIRRSVGTLHRSNAVRRSRHAATDAPADGRAPDNDVPDASANPASDENANAGNDDRSETVFEEAEADRWLDDMSQAVVHRAGQNIVSLLFRVSEDNARRSSYVHRGCACNACGIVPIRGIRYRCANCADFDLCETCESQGLHIKTHIFYKVKVPAPPFGPRQMQPVWYTGDPDTRVRNLGKNLINRLSRETGFERQELEAFWEQWTYMANTEWRDDPDDLGLAMDRKTFERCLVPSGGYRHTAPNLIHDRMFAFYDTNNDELIGFSEFLHGLSYRKRKDKLRKIFDGYDTDRDGYVSRRDFLRFFRAYYVLYKQMQKDILEGLDDQAMSSIETHQLVHGRQPLSSLFGREGRVPMADRQRVMAGKSINMQTGEPIVEDSPNGVVAEDGADTANREDLMARLFTRWRRYVTASGMYEDRYDTVGQDDLVDELDEGLAATNYWDALLNPPATVQELPSLLLGQVDPSSQLHNGNTDNDDGDDDNMFVPSADTYGNNDGGDGLYWVGLGSAAERPHANGASSLEEPPAAAQPAVVNGASGGSANGTSNSRRRSAGAGVAAASSSRPPQYNPHHPPTPGQLRSELEASIRAQKLRAVKTAARRKLHNRWVRRNFYLDEEEGATAPAGWQPESDILAGAPISDAAGEPSTSRVRFTEGTASTAAADDYENQPSPSSSARTVLPDTWGGDGTRYPDIPEAERDAGREILYQVMQQSFNEMLDTLFVEQEDLAIEAAETKEKRNKYRHLFEDISFLDRGAANGSGGPAEQPDKEAAPGLGSGGSGGILDRPVQQLDLDELLNMTGYQLDESALGGNGEGGEGGARAAATSTAANAPNEAELAVVDRLVREGAPEPESEAGDASGRPEAGDEEGGEEEEHAEAAAPASESEPRDPTLPQFRPNSEAEYRAMVEARAVPATTARCNATLSATVEDAAEDKDRDKGKDKEEDKEEMTAHPNRKKRKTEASSSSTSSPASAEIPQWELLRWKRLDVAERDAAERGGWGKLSYSEFEAIFRREELKNNRLDYLGSWIDFCIP